METNSEVNSLKENIILSQYLNDNNTKVQLSNTARKLNIAVKKHWRKADISFVIVNFMLHFPNDFFDMMPLEELEEIKYKAENNLPDDGLISTFKEEFCLSWIGILPFSVQMKRIGLFYPCTKEIILTRIIKYLEQTDQEEAIVYHRKIILGLLNLYGFLEKKNLFLLYQKYTNGNSETFTKTVNEYYLLNRTNKTYNNNSLAIFHSPCVDDIEDLLTKRSILTDIKFKNFRAQEVLDAGNSRTPLPPNYLIKDLKEFLFTLFESEKIVDGFCSNLWMLLNKEMPLDYVVEINLKYIKETTGFDRDTDPAKYDVFIEIFAKTVNSLPRWKYKGNATNDEIFEEEEEKKATTNIPLQIESDPTLDKELKDAMQKEFEKRIYGATVETAVLSKKIGRNDICPCGSGLKYKKCCLNN